MYVSAREIEAHQGKLADAITMVNWVVGQINEKHGGDMHVAIEVGGNPNAIWVTGVWESMADYEAMRASYMADEEIKGALGFAASVASMVEDRLAQVLRPPGDRAAYATLSMAKVDLTEISEAIPFCLEVAELASNITGHQTGLVRAITGDANDVLWFTFADSLATIQEADDKLMGDSSFMDLYKRSATVMVPGSLTNGLRQYVS